MFTTFFFIINSILLPLIQPSYISTSKINYLNNTITILQNYCYINNSIITNCYTTFIYDINKTFLMKNIQF